MAQEKERLMGFDFIRTVCAVGIIIYHYFCHTSSDFRPLYHYQNGGNWGSTFVTAFFVISGAVLYLNYHEKLGGRSLKEFYYKRWKALFPMFYIGYAFFYVEKIFDTGSVFWGGNRCLLVQSLFGMDGYLHYIWPDNYYLIGEWFFGAIVLLYLLYPVLLWFFRKNVWIVTGVLWALFGVTLFVIDDFTNVISCILSFESGMLIIYYRKYLLQKKMIGVAALGGLLAVVCVDLHLQWNIAVHLAGICLFFVLYYLGQFLEQLPVCSKVIKELGGNLSFPIFLVQHIVVLKVQGVRNPTAPGRVLVMICIAVVLSILYAKVLSLVSKAVTGSEVFRRFEAWILKGRAERILCMSETENGVKNNEWGRFKK